ncbi:MAG: helix-turn-helix domain-containing protein [Porcipelethomonas sp.]
MNSEFPKIITEERKKRKLSQKQAAADLGISQALLSHYEKGIRECGLDFVVKIADYYDVSCDSLLGHSDAGDTPAQKGETTEDLQAVYETAASILSAGREAGGEEFEKEILSFIMLNFYKLLRMIKTDENPEDGGLFSIPTTPAENLTDSVIMNICASIKLKSSKAAGEISEKVTPDSSLKKLISSSESKISEFHSFP